MRKNLLLLDDCFLGKQNKDEAYYTRGRHNNCDTIYIAQNSFRLPQTFKLYILRKMVIPGERITEKEEGSQGTDDADSVSDTASIGDTETESSDIASPANAHKALDEASSSSGMSPTPARSHGKAKKEKKDRNPFYKCYGYEGRGVVYHPGDSQRNCIY